MITKEEKRTMKGVTPGLYTFADEIEDIIETELIGGVSDLDDEEFKMEVGKLKRQIHEFRYALTYFNTNYLNK